MNDPRESIYDQMLCALLEGHRLLNEYDSVPRRYGTLSLFQAESHMIQEIGEHPGTTVTELAETFRKTTSACSQLVRRLRAKGLVHQTRDETNNRVYHLSLTPAGLEIHQSHRQYDASCRSRELRYLESFSNEDLKLFLAIQKQLNEAFREDIRAHTL